LEAEIILEYDDGQVAEAVTKAVSPDNFEKPKGLKIKTVCKQNKVITRIACEEKLQMFIATIDDLLFCTATAEKAIQATKKVK
jgi:hypothetical protein